MNLKPVAVAVLAVACAVGVQAATSTTYEAAFRDLGDGSIRLDGFGRGGAGGWPVDSFASRQSTLATEFFHDTWNIRTSEISPGLYNASNMVVDAFNGVVFSAVTLNSYDALGVRTTVLFDLNALGTQAVGSGTFTVLPTCPVQSCVWIDVFGTQPVGGGGGAGYGGEPVAVLVPEPGSWALLALGLAVIGGAARRRRA